jgi:NADPH:quinone reductase-like Zn-dependent oxidoreductase
VTLDFFDWVDDTVGAPVIQFDYLRGTRTVAADLATLVALVEAGRLHPELDRIRDWTDTAAAIDDLRHRRIRGNLVLTVGTA